MMEQICLQRATAKGNIANLVQCAIRAPGHCDFTVAEQATAFADMVKWVEYGVKPATDDVLTASVVAQLNYGCARTDDAVSVDDSTTVKAWRATGKLPACPARCRVGLSPPFALQQCMQIDVLQFTCGKPTLTQHTFERKAKTLQ